MTDAVYRVTPLPWGMLRWMRMDCGSDACEGHRVGVVGLEVCGVMRWMVLIEDIPGWATGAEGRWEAMLEELEPEHVAHYRLVAAAVGIDWLAVDFRQITIQSNVIGSLPATAIHELSAQGEEGLIGLRRLVGSDIGAVPVLLHHMGAYRENVGGMPAREGWRP